jgi:DNA-binding NarL/FixJ family response regulator
MQSNNRSLLGPANVYLVAENRLLRETLVRLFRKRADLCIVGNTCCSAAAIEHIASVHTDVLLLDCFNNNHRSDDWLNELQETIPGIKIILFGMDETPDVFVRAVRRGIVGYVLKNASAVELLEALRTVAQGEAACPSQLCKVLFAALRRENMEPQDSAAAGQYSLTQRQRQLMSLVAMGLSNKEIAANLNLSEFTVKNHIYRVMRQVDAQSRHEAVALIRDGN